jgi:hypothetical protein
MADPAERPKVNPHFEPSERLFRRVPREDVENGFISNASIRLPAFSVDRETYLVNGPADTLRKYPDMGLIWFCVGDIPAALTSENGDRFEFGVEHRPEEDNAAHSEVLSYRGGVEVNKLPDGVKKKFRDALRLKIPPSQMAKGPAPFS